MGIVMLLLFLGGTYFVVKKAIVDAYDEIDDLKNQKAKDKLFK